MGEQARVARDLGETDWEKGIGPGIVCKKLVGPKDSNSMLSSVAQVGLAVLAL